MEKPRGKYVFNRAMFLELLFRLSVHILDGANKPKQGTINRRKDNSKTDTKGKSTQTKKTSLNLTAQNSNTENKTEGVSKTYAFHVFMEHKFVPYH